MEVQGEARQAQCEMLGGQAEALAEQHFGGADSGGCIGRAECCDEGADGGAGVASGEFAWIGELGALS